jgi:hypothetical protein
MAAPSRTSQPPAFAQPRSGGRVGLLLGAAVLLLGAIAPALAHAQLLVHPRRPGQTNVRYADFDWRYVDLLTHEKMKVEIEWQRGPRFHLSPYRAPAMGTPWAWPSLTQAPISPSMSTTRDARPPPGPGKGVLETAGGIRLYFYERERVIAERAAASIEASYRYLAEQFGYAPRKTFAYFLYSSYIEFLQTELFPIQEGVLGVTSPESLELTLPYFGDQRLFEDVSTHELAHEFTLQKLLTAAKDAELPDAPLMQIPVWFIEGSAEFYAKHGLDPEAEVLVRDLVVNPTEDGYVLGDFFEDRLADGLWTYKVGQARCAFLEDTYGKGTLQRILEQSPSLAKPADKGGVASFRALLGRIVKDRPSRISARFERWIKRRAFSSYLATTQDSSDGSALSEVQGLVQTLSTSPSGQLLLYRSIDRDTGTTSLYLVDRHAPDDDKRIASDGTPGIESLHPVSGRNFDLTDSEVAFVAQRGGRDVIYVQRFAHDAVPEPCGKKGPRAASVCSWDVGFDLGPRRVLPINKHKMLTVDALALSPNGRALAFVGLSESGQKDLYMIPRIDDEQLTIVQLTHDQYAEREVSWGPSGIVFNSDATGHGKYNLFRIDPLLPTKIERLTFEPRDEMSPEVLPDGRVFFVAYDAAGANIYEVKREPEGTRVLRHTDVSTGLYDVSAGPDGSVWALYHHGHRRLPVRIGAGALLAQPTEAPPTDSAAKPPERLSLSVDRKYNPFSLSNWAPEGFFILAGFSTNGIFGSLVATASDRLRDHGLILSAAIYGSFDLLDVDLTYFNQERRLIWGLSVFHEVYPLFDDSFKTSDPKTSVKFVSWRRFMGSGGVLRYPFSQFLYAQAELSAGASSYFVTSETEKMLSDPKQNLAGRNLFAPWEAQNQGFRFHTETALSLGYSTIGYHRSTGPIRGSSLLLASSFGTEPFDAVTYEQARVDTEHYIRIIGAANLMFRGAGGMTLGNRRAPQYFLSSFHTLRGVPFGDTDFLLGREFFYSTVELQFPIATFMEFPLIDLEGVLATDFGGVGNGANGIWDHRVLDFAFGVNLGFAPLVLRLHLGQPIGIGTSVPNGGRLVFNFSIAWRYQ